MLMLMCICYINIKGGAGVPCPPLALPFQAALAPCCMCASLGVAPVPSSALVYYWFDAVRT